MRNNLLSQVQLIRRCTDHRHGRSQRLQSGAEDEVCERKLPPTQNGGLGVLTQEILRNLALISVQFNTFWTV